LKDVVRDEPGIDFLTAERVYVPGAGGYDPQGLSWCVVEVFLTEEQLRYAVKYKNWAKESLDAYEEAKSADDSHSRLDTYKDMREGIERAQEGRVRVWECYGHWDIGAGYKQKSVVTLLPDFDIEARKVLLDTYSGRYPLVKLFYELTDDRWYSHRGVPEILMDLIEEIDVQHNMKIDIQTMTNFPMILYRPGVINPKTARMNPTQMIPVSTQVGMDDAMRVLNLHNAGAEYSYEREQMLLEGQVQELIGQVDYTLQSQVNRRQPRTLGEVNQQVMESAKLQSLDVMHYVKAFGRIAQMVYELWLQYGPESYEFNYFGERQGGESIRISREELQGQYRIKIRGNDQNTNPALRMQKAQMLFMSIMDERLIGLGITDPVKIAAGFKKYLQAQGVDDWQNYVNEQPQPRQGPDPKTAIEPKYDDLDPDEQAQVLEAFNIKPDVGTKIEKRNYHMVDKALEVASGLEESVGSAPSAY
jgi:hypothetical protein